MFIKGFTDMNAYIGKVDIELQFLRKTKLQNS